MQKHRPGETVRLTIKRGEQTLNITSNWRSSTGPADQQNSMNSMGVGVSKRSDDFPAVIQHDTVIKPVDCGGPVVDLERESGRR